MEISTLLDPGAVRLLNNVSSKKRLFQDLADIAEDVYGLKAGLTVEALLDRESLGPTGVGQGVALPHARLEGLDRVVGCFLRIEHPVDFNSVDRRPVDLVFALLAPAENGVEHLRALASVARTLRDANICQKLRSNADVGTLHAILTELEVTRAA